MNRLLTENRPLCSKMADSEEEFYQKRYYPRTHDGRSARGLVLHHDERSVVFHRPSAGGRKTTTKIEMNHSTTVKTIENEIDSEYPTMTYQPSGFDLEEGSDRRKGPKANTLDNTCEETSTSYDYDLGTFDNPMICRNIASISYSQRKLGMTPETLNAIPLSTPQHAHFPQGGPLPIQNPQGGFPDHQQHRLRGRHHDDLYPSSPRSQHRIHRGSGISRTHRKWPHPNRRDRANDRRCFNPSTLLSHGDSTQ